MFYILMNLLRDLLRPRRDLLLENLALRQQILVLSRTNPKPPFSLLDKAFWVVLYRKWENWRRPLAVVKPETVIAWHRQGWRLWWRWKSRPKEVGRPRIPYEVTMVTMAASSPCKPDDRPGCQVQTIVR